MICRAHNFIDLTGQRFGRLSVIASAGVVLTGKTNKKFSLWLCRCECGNETKVRGIKLRSGHTSSCGCLSRERASTSKLRHGENSRRHGMTAEYRCWAAVKTRCMNPKASGYDQYGGRGIQVCDRWKTFENFLADMGRKPSPEHSIDRYPDGDGNYEPGNCRWATKSEQRLNQRKSKTRGASISAARKRMKKDAYLSV